MTDLCTRCAAPVFAEDGTYVHGTFVGRKCIDGTVREPEVQCIHPGLDHRSSRVPTDPDEYDRWLYATRRCHHCGADVPNRDL